ncbi:MAG: hypothetical protein FJW79_09050 [Actinobacteria bacterium]|nr:hypothetical protein [Actinomycetota bacterium]
MKDAARRSLIWFTTLLLLGGCGGGDRGTATSATAGDPPATTATAGEPLPTTSAEAPATTVFPTTAPPFEPPRGVTFPAADGTVLEGRAFPAGDTWILLAHMYPADMASWFDFATAAQEAGFTALAYNNRGYGGSEGTRDLIDVGSDALGAIAFARSNGADRVLFFGASMNGAAALFAAAEEDLAGIASLSGVPEWHNTPGLARAGDVTEPALFIAAEDDRGAVGTAEVMAAAVAGDTRVVVYPAGGHGTAMFRANPGLAALLLDFARSHG